MSDKGWRFRGNERAYVDEVLAGGFTAGACGFMSERLEQGFAARFDRPFAIAANSGTSTLHMALAAVGVGPGDEVIIPALTVAMCGFVVVQCGATPVYADVLPDTFLIDPDAVARLITPRTRAIMVVHLYGLMADMTALQAIAAAHGLPVVEDCAQCYLAHDQQGRLAGTVGQVGSWSFENSKHLSCGEGGMVLTADEGLATFMRQFGGLGFQNVTARSGKVRIDRDRFQDPDWERHNRIGYNYRLSELSAAVALAQLERLDHFVALRHAMGETYRQVIAAVGGEELLTPQRTPAGHYHSYFTFAARFRGAAQGLPWQTFRKQYMALGGDGIYACWKPVPLEPAFRDAAIGWGDAPVAVGLQRDLMQFTTNQADAGERERQGDILAKTLRHFLGN